MSESKELQTVRESCTDPLVSLIQGPLSKSGILSELDYLFSKRDANELIVIVSKTDKKSKSGETIYNADIYANLDEIKKWYGL